MARTVEGPVDRRLTRPRNPRGEGGKLRNDILDAADALLSESRDVDSLSLRAVARRVGIAAPSVYLHFSNIDDLKRAVVERGFADLDAARDEVSKGVADPVEALLARSVAYAEHALAHPGRYRLMFGPDLPPALAFDATHSPSRHSFDELLQSIKRCQEARRVPLSLDATRLATDIWASIHGIVTLRMDRPMFPWPPLQEMVTGIVSRLAQLDVARIDPSTERRPPLRATQN